MTETETLDQPMTLAELAEAGARAIAAEAARAAAPADADDMASISEQLADLRRRYERCMARPAFDASKLTKGAAGEIRLAILRAHIAIAHIPSGR